MRLMVMYCEPPISQKPAIRAEEAAVTVSKKRNNDNNAIFDVNWSKTPNVRKGRDPGGCDYHIGCILSHCVTIINYQCRLVV